MRGGIVRIRDKIARLIALEVRCRGFGRLGGAEPRTLVSGFIHPGILVHWTSAL